jgi:hypothetical protein
VAVVEKKQIDIDLEFLPRKLLGQCLLLIEQYHETHGYGCLPDILWRSGLGSFIEQTEPFSRQLVRASKTRRVKEANSIFAEMATTILALEILASSFYGWSSLFPEAAKKSCAILGRSTRLQTPLMNHYVRPPDDTYARAAVILSPDYRFSEL